MINKIKEYILKNYIYIIVFFASLFIYLCFPLTGDDWLNWESGNHGLINMAKSTVHYYLTWGGRIGSSVFVLFLTQYKWLWNIANAFVTVLLVWCTNKIVATNKKVFVAVCFILMLMLSNMMMIVEGFLWIAGSITYTFCLCALLLYIVYVLYKEKNEIKKSKWEYVIVGFLTLGMCTFVENIAVGIIVANILLVLYKYIRNNNIDTFYLSMLIFSIIGLLIQLVSPGTATRISIDDAEFATLNIFQKVLANIPNFIKFTYIINPMMLVILVIALDVLILKKEKNGVLKILLMIFFNIIPFITIIANLNKSFIYDVSILNTINEKLSFVSNSENGILIIYWILFSIMIIFSIVKYCNKEDKYENLFIYSVAISTIVSMMITTVWHERASIAVVIMIYILSLKLIFKNINEEKRFNSIRVLISVLALIVAVIYLITYNNVRIFVKDRNENIYKQIEEGKKEIIYYTMPGKYCGSQYPYKQFYVDAFNYYMGIEESVTYKEVKSIWKYQMFYDKLY